MSIKPRTSRIASDNNPMAVRSLIKETHHGGSYFFNKRFRKRVATQFWRFKRPAKIDFILNRSSYTYCESEEISA